MALNISDLLKWKRRVALNDKDGNPIEDGVMWVRVLGDWDLTESFKAARIESARLRRQLKDTDSDDYINETAALESISSEDMKTVIKNTKSNDFLSLALANVDRGDLPKIDEIAVEPDAPTLEEQEKLDDATKKVGDDYQKSLMEYLDERNKELDAELAAMSPQQLRERCIEAIQSLLPNQAFMVELATQKAYRASYKDEACKERAFTRQEFLNLETSIKDQIVDAYNLVEVSTEDVKN